VISDTILGSYEQLVATHPEIERKGAKMPYTAINGHMFSFLTPNGTLALRLPADQRDRFRGRYATPPIEQHGAVMKEYVAVPADLLGHTDELKPWFDLSVAYVGSLKPKATKRASS
jgi:TfoX/Sxy family transcriptional regulator of competence genes